jgi:hypothetical protein
MHSDWGYVHAMDVPRWHLAAALNDAEASAMESEVGGTEQRCVCCAAGPAWRHTCVGSARGSGCL